MHFSLTSLIRLLAFLVLIVSLMAIGLSKVVPEENGGHRKFNEPRYVGVNGSIFTPPTQKNFLLDRETGELLTSGLVKESRGLDFAALAPWKGEDGKIEVAGRLIERSSTSSGQIFISAGVARCDFPSGKVLDSAEVEPVVSGAPCWLPGASRRIVFPAAGDLFIQEFSNGTEEQSPPRRIVAGSAFPGELIVVFHDVLCPTTPRLGGRLLVSLSFNDPTRKPSRLKPSQLWSIKLDPVRAEVVSAEKILDTKGDTGSNILPNITKTPDGKHVLTYLSRRGSQDSWSLILAPVEFDPLTHTPLVHESQTVKVGAACAFSRPEFSIDGRFVHRVRAAQSSDSPLDRIPVIETLNAGARLVSTSSN